MHTNKELESEAPLATSSEWRHFVVANVRALLVASKLALATIVALALGFVAGCMRSPSISEDTNVDSDKRTQEPERCQPVRDVHLFVFPNMPVVGAPLRVLAVTDKPLVAELVITNGNASPSQQLASLASNPHSLPDAKDAADGSSEHVVSNVRHGGPPYFWVAEIAAPHDNPKGYIAKLVQRSCRADENVASRMVPVQGAARSAPASSITSKGGIWPTESEWSHDLENVYSAWIETLFDTADDTVPSWDALDQVLRDRKRNLLFDYLGAGEDSIDAPGIRPDCADLPYFLRAYFAFKLKLPFGVSQCTRGGGGSPPKCKPGTITNEDQQKNFEPSAMRNFAAFLRTTVADRVHSGTARTAIDDEQSDYYPVPLRWESLRPGTVYADPYGHTLVLTKRSPQNSAKRSGTLFAVDAQPDGTVSGKRFWRGTFLYAKEHELGGPGWKRFRPLVKSDGGGGGGGGAGHKLVRMSDDAIRASPDYGDVSYELASLGVEEFFDAMDDLLAPTPLDPRIQIVEIIGELQRQMQTRVGSVDSGREWLATARTPAAMPPSLIDLFETTGTWEEYSTPSRDLRLLVAMDYVAGFPARVARRPTHYAMPTGMSTPDVAKELDAILARELSARKISYPRTDGSSFTLSLADVFGRESALEVAYNPNDCVEFRWGAPNGSDEETTCHARAPAAQQERMEHVRAWFHERRRPPRR